MSRPPSSLFPLADSAPSTRLSKEGNDPMNSLAVRRAAGILLVIVPLGFAVCFTLLQQLFEYPDILRQPTADVLAKFVAGGAPLVAVWYVLTLTAVAFVPLTLLVHRVLSERDAPVLLWVATTFGLIAGV